MASSISDGRGRRAVILAAAAAAVIALAVVYRHMGAADPARAATAPVPVTVTRVVKQDVPIYLDGLGTAQAFNAVVLRVRADGPLTKVLFTEGQDVKAGDLLAEIDPRPFEADLRQAEAKKAQDQTQLPMAQRDLQRFQSLAQNNFATEQTLDKQRATVDQLEAALKADEAMVEHARLNLSYTKITAPIEGRIGLRRVDVGNVVHVGDPDGLAAISQIHPISVVFTLPADTLSDITAAMANGKPAVSIFSSDNKKTLAEGRLLTIESSIDQATGTLRLKSTAPNANDALWPGLSVRAHLLLRTEAGALVLGETAVQRGPAALFVYVVLPDMTVAVRPVEADAVGRDLVVVRSGLAEGEQVVLSGQSRLRPGARVVTTDADAKNKTGG